MDIYQDLKQAEKGAWTSISVYIGLSLLKLMIGYGYNSDALLADGLNNTTDIIASIAILIGLRISRKPPDEDHPYGHFRAETVASLLAAFIMAVVGIQVLIQAGQQVFLEKSEAPEPITAWTSLFSACIMYGVYMYNRSLAKRVSSSSLMAAAQDNRSDALVSVGAFAGIIGARLGWHWLDPLAAVLVGLVICKTAWDIFRESSHALTDGFNDESKLEAYRTTIAKTPGVESIEDIKARVHGNQVLIDVTIHVASTLNVAEGHQISENVENQMRKKYRIAHVHVHIEPAEA